MNFLKYIVACLLFLSNISLSIDMTYNNSENIDMAINQFIDFRKKILNKRSPNYVFKVKF